MTVSEEELFEGGLLRGAIESIRGHFIASMYEKRNFAKLVLSHLEDGGYISSWSVGGASDQFDHAIEFSSGIRAAVTLKGCLDGDNTRLFERPDGFDEFYIWSICQNAGADPRRNAWSGIHTRIGAEVVVGGKRVDGLIIWDMVCNSIGRPCPKITDTPERITEIAQYRLPPPCLYTLPATILNPGQNLDSRDEFRSLQFLNAMIECFGVRKEEVYKVRFEIRVKAGKLERQTRVELNELATKTSRWTSMRSNA